MDKQKALLLVILLACVAPMMAQVNLQSDTTIYRGHTEKAASFPGGADALNQFVGENFTYPDDTDDLDISGNIVAQFFVTTEGAIEDIRIIKSLFPSLDEELVRILKLMPPWEPAILFKIPKRSTYTYSIYLEIGYGGGD